MKTIICPSSLKERILRKAASANHGIAEGIETLPFPVALKEEKDNDESVSMTLASLLREKKKAFPIYGDMFKYPLFIQEILSFVRECILYGISAEELPSSNNNEEELKKICTEAFTLDLAEKKNAINDPKMLKRLQENADLIVYPQFISDPYHYRMMQALKKTASIYQEEKVHPQIHLNYALNPRQEMEAIAQDICKRNETCNIVLTSMDTQLPLLDRVFTAYHIPYSANSIPVELHTPRIYFYLIKLGMQKDKDSLLTALSEDCFPSFIPDDVFSYLNEMMVDTLIPEKISEILKGSVFDDHTLLYADLEEKTEQYFDQIQEDLTALLSSKTQKEILLNAYAILRRSPYMHQLEELKTGTRIRKAIIEHMNKIDTEEELNYFAELILCTSATESLSVTDFCTVTSLTEPLPQADNTYVLSVNGKNYPNVPSKSGLFDEAYFEKLKNYPSREERYSLYMDQLEWISHSCKHELFYSYYTNDYQGREQQISFDIDNLYHALIQRWDLEETPPSKQLEHSIDSKTAEQLFVQDGEIYGSVSSIEKWFQCPYAYFLSSGLRVRKLDSTDPEASTFGTIQHAIMENAIKLHQKQYPSITEEEIHALIEPYFSLIEKMHPSSKDSLDLSKKRMMEGMLSALSFLKDFENNTSFEPAETEKQFSEAIIPGIRLKGIIDRYDTYGKEMFRIIDYKSSKHSLSETKISQGLQLQLLSYLIIAQRMYQMTPAGAFYFSLKQEDSSVPAAKTAGRGKNKEIIETDMSKTAEEERNISNKSLTGWKFTDRETEMDQSGTHMKPKKLYDYDAVEKCITIIYVYFKNSLLDGNISLSPIQNACTFCDYGTVCRFHGERRTPAVITDMPLTAKEEK